MNIPSTPENLLQQIARIQVMEQGKLCILRQGPNGPYYNLQRWENRRNISEYVPATQLPAVQANLAAYAQFEALIDQYVHLLSTRSREQRLTEVKKRAAADFLLAQEAEIEALMTQFAARTPTGESVQQLEVLLRTALFKPANALLEHLLQEAVDRIDAAYQPKLGQVRKGRAALVLQGIFGSMTLQRDYYYHPGKAQGHYPADAALGLEVAYTLALARLMCLEGADESSFEKASAHLQECGGIAVSGRQIQRVVQRVGEAAVAWQKRESAAVPCAAPIKDGVSRIIANARSRALNSGQKDAVEKALGYFEHNVARMQYGSFRQQGFFIGSGVIEAGCNRGRV